MIAIMKITLAKIILRMLKHFSSYTATVFSEEMQYILILLWPAVLHFFTEDGTCSCIATETFEYPQKYFVIFITAIKAALECCDWCPGAYNGVLWWKRVSGVVTRVNT